MKLLCVWQQFHHKNMNALLSYKSITCTVVSSIDKCPDLSQYDVVYSPGITISVANYPNTKFIFGPHFAPFPGEHEIGPIRGPNSCFILPSQWVIDMWKAYSITCNLNMIAMPFGVDTDQFAPVDCHKENVFIYMKHRSPEDLQFVEHMLSILGISYSVFYYSRYHEVDYIEFLKTAKYGIWLGAHESQGFALEEALSMNVPLFVWGIRTLNQEYMSSYPPVPATTIPYWDSSCGEVIYEKDEFLPMFSKFLEGHYSPREFVVNHLSRDVCDNRFLQLCNEMKYK